MKRLFSDATLDSGVYMVVDYVGLGADSAELRSEGTMKMLEYIKELRLTKNTDSLDAEGVVALFDEKKSEQGRHNVYNANLVKSVGQSASHSTGNTLRIGSSDMTDKDAEEAVRGPLTVCKSAQENTWLELAHGSTRSTA